MLEWKILAAAFSALLVISIVLVGNTGVKDMFGGIIGKITDWMGGTQISLPGGLGSGKANAVSVTLYPKNFILTPGYKLNLTLGQSYLESFNGDIIFDFDSGQISLRDKSGLSLSSPMQSFAIQNLSLSRLQIKGMKFAVHAQTDISSENGTMDIRGFFGTFSVQDSSIALQGNVTKITGDGWSVG
jgi:hypothetical protein